MLFEIISGILPLTFLGGKKKVIRSTAAPLLSHSLLCTQKHKSSLTSTSVQESLQHFIFLQKHRTTTVLQVWDHLLQVSHMKKEHDCPDLPRTCRNHQQIHRLALIIIKSRFSLIWTWLFSFFLLFYKPKTKTWSHHCSVSFWRAVCVSVLEKTLFLSIPFLRSDIINIKCFSFMM